MEERALEVDKEEIAAKGERIYRSIQEKLEQSHKGEYVAIETESGEYFLGKTLQEADSKARAKYPDRVFYVMRIGYPAVYVHR